MQIQSRFTRLVGSRLHMKTTLETGRSHALSASLISTSIAFAEVKPEVHGLCRALKEATETNGVNGVTFTSRARLSSGVTASDSPGYRRGSRSP
jgi:hypothetical protein